MYQDLDIHFHIENVHRFIEEPEHLGEKIYSSTLSSQLHLASPLSPTVARGIPQRDWLTRDLVFESLMY